MFAIAAITCTAHSCSPLQSGCCREPHCAKQGHQNADPACSASRCSNKHQHQRLSLFWACMTWWSIPAVDSMQTKTMVGLVLGQCMHSGLLSFAAGHQLVQNAAGEGVKAVLLEPDVLPNVWSGAAQQFCAGDLLMAVHNMYKLQIGSYGFDALTARAATDSSNMSITPMCTKRCSCFVARLDSSC